MGGERLLLAAGWGLAAALCVREGRLWFGRQGLCLWALRAPAVLRAGATGGRVRFMRLVASWIIHWASTYLSTPGCIVYLTWYRNPVVIAGEFGKAGRRVLGLGEDGSVFTILPTPPSLLKPGMVRWVT